MQHHTIDELRRRMGARPQTRWLEFLRTASLSMGVYHLRAGETDNQTPHSEDEVYYVVAGSASFRAGEERVRVQPGSVLFVERLRDHRFVDIDEDLTVLVFFAPPEGSRKAQADEPEIT